MGILDFLFGGGDDPEQARPAVTDVSAVRNADGEFVTSRSYAETVDLISEGPIEGITSGTYTYIRDTNITGYQKVVFNNYWATGVAGGNKTTAQAKELGFLRSIFWNEVPIVDQNGFYNYPDININYTKGTPIGTVPKINDALPQLGSIPSSDIMDLSINRPIGERLYGPEIKGGDDTPTDVKYAKIKGPIDKYSKTYRVLNKECNKLIVNIKITALQESLQFGPKTYTKRPQATGYGDQKARRIEYFIFYRPIFNKKFKNIESSSTAKTDLNEEGWRLGKKELVEGKIDSGYIRATVLDFSDRGFQDKEGFEGWQIRIVRTTPESLTSFLRNQSFVDSLVEVYGTKLTYPYSSMAYSIFDARSFQRIPTRAYDTHLLKVKIPNNYNPFLKSYGESSQSATSYYKGIAIGAKTNSLISSDKNTWTRASSSASTVEEWDGNFAEELCWTDNPAWCFYDLITNNRYGLGDYISLDQVDKWALYDIAKYCDELVDDTYGGFEPRFTINYLITTREEAFKVLNDLSSIFRGISYYTNGSIFSAQDKYKLPVFHFNNSNVVDSNFTYASSAKKARHTVAIVRYNDKRNSYKPAVEYLEDEEGVKRYGIREIQTSALGCTSRGQARRFAKWIIASEYEETETVSFSAGGEGAYLRPGDIITIYDNNRNPFKLSGRTNAVIQGNENINPVYKLDENPLTTFQRQNVNSIIVDQALNLEDGIKYKFSLLAPTYDYYSGTIETSDDLPGIRRTQIQNLAFNGSDAINVTGVAGAFRSDFVVDNKAVCTQIYFNSGMRVEDVAGAAKGNVGSPYTGNQLNFQDYVITGYTNSAVEGYNNQGIDYSGNYFSGQNLIWSIEPLFDSEPSYLNNHESSYRIINIKEEENHAYNIQALAYSTGKYENIDTIGSSYSSSNDLQIYFPISENASQSNSLSQWTSSYPNQTYSPNATEGQRNNNILTVIEDQPSINGIIQDNLVTIKSEFSVAGFKNNIVMGNESKSTSVNYGQTLSANRISYSFSIITTGNPQITNNWNALNDPRITPVVNTSAQDPRETSVTYLVAPEYYEDISQNEYLLITSEDTKFFNNEKSKIEVEALVSSINRDNGGNVLPFYIVVYPISDDGVIGHGLLRGIRPSTEAIKKLTTPVQAYTINGLTTRGADGLPVQAGTPSDPRLFALDNTQPEFEWQISSQDPIFNRPSTEESDFGRYELNFTNVEDIQYRVTVRKPSTTNIPSSHIYFEFTGYTSPSTKPTFVFDETYNNPDIISDISSDGQTYNNDNLNNRGIGRHIIRAEDGAIKDIFYKSVDSGVVIRDTQELPLREFDIVVETQDVNGRTSVDNYVYANTINQDTNENPEKYAENLFNAGYDILGVSIDSPSGVFFAQSNSEKGFSNRIFDMDTVFNRNYPYKATARLITEGGINITIEEVENKEGESTITAEEADKFFNDARGVVYYFTTGDAQTETTEDTTTFSNLSPQFDLDIEKQKSNNKYLLKSNKNIEEERASKIKNLEVAVDGGTQTKGVAFDGVVTTNRLSAEDAAADNGSVVRRGFYLFEGGDTIGGFTIPFPIITREEVTNIQFCMAFFDSISFKRAFEQDSNLPLFDKITVNNETKQLAKIFSDTKLNFSTLPLSIDAVYSIDNALSTDKPTAFLNPLGTSFRMGEFNANSNAVSSLGYQAWGEVVVGANQKDANQLNFDPEPFGYSNQPETSVSHILGSDYYIKGQIGSTFAIDSSILTESNNEPAYKELTVNKKFGVTEETTLEGNKILDGSANRRPSLVKGSTDLNNIKVYGIAKTSSYNRSWKAIDWNKLPNNQNRWNEFMSSYATIRTLIMTVPLTDDLANLPTDRYSVDLSMQGYLNISPGSTTHITHEYNDESRSSVLLPLRGVASEYLASEVTNYHTEYRVIKGVGVFHAIIRQWTNNYLDANNPTNTHTIWNRTPFEGPANLVNIGGLKIKFGVLADLR